MPRESTIKYEFMLEASKVAKAILVTPGTITAGPTTVIMIDPTDPGWATDPVTYAPGNLLFVDGTGWASLDGMVHMITATVPLTGEVTLDVDTSTETATLPASVDITAQAILWDHVCLSEFTPNPGTPGEIDVTTMCDTERKNLPGLPTPGTASFTGMFDLEDDGMVALMDAQKDAVARYFIGSTRRGQLAVFHGVVSAFSIGALTVEAAVTYTGSFTLDESPYYMINPVLAGTP